MVVNHYNYKWSHGQQLCAKMTKVWVVFFSSFFFHFYLLGCLSHLCLCKHHRTMLIFGKERRRKKKEKKEIAMEWLCRSFLLDRFPRVVDMALEGS